MENVFKKINKSDVFGDYPRNRQHCKTTKEGLPIFGLSLFQYKFTARTPTRQPSPPRHHKMASNLMALSMRRCGCVPVCSINVSSLKKCMYAKNSQIGWIGRSNWKRFCTSQKTSELSLDSSDILHTANSICCQATLSKVQVINPKKMDDLKVIETQE